MICPICYQIPANGGIKHYCKQGYGPTQEDWAEGMARLKRYVRRVYVLRYDYRGKPWRKLWRPKFVEENDRRLSTRIREDLGK